MLNRLRALIPRSETHLLLSRPGASAGSEFAVPGVEVQAGEADALEAFTAEVGFPAGWAIDVLDEGAWAILAVDQASRAPLAMGWGIARPFYVEEIGATVDPGPGGIYLFGDFVAPAARGRKLQRLLVSERVRRAAESARAFTIVHPTNTASLRSYRNEGFETRARYTRTHWAGRSWASCRGRGFNARRNTLLATD
jgi:ribosomal protein S18 acetylase RimI-like enzyme